MVTIDQILKRLPPYRDEWQLISQHQYVSDIITEVNTSHRLYREMYDRFYDLFKAADPGELADVIADFCRSNIKYIEESKDVQTSGIPTGFLTRRRGDCKHYSLFAAGVIDAINRNTGAGIPCYFYFAGYNDAKEPHHVFVVVVYDNQEIWIDPTPGGGDEPTLLVIKKVNG